MNKFMCCYGNKYPDLAKCRTSGVGAIIPGTTRQMYYCSINNADCRYARPLGFDYICKHPNCHDFPKPEDEEPKLLYEFSQA